MYEVSQAYMDALLQPFKVRRLTGTIGSTPFDDSNLVGGAFIVDNQCSEGTEIRIGSVYVGQVQAVFHGISLNGEWYGKEIRASEGLRLLDGETYEDVPLGVYHVVEANHAEDGVHVTAYDNMHLLDKTFTLSTTSGTIWDYLQLIATDCGVSLGQTEAEIRVLPNGTRGFILYAENDIETYRDLLHWVAQTCACFATCDRQGRIVLRQYGGETVDAIGVSQRWRGASFSDFESYYTGVSVVRMEDGETEYLGAEPDDGLTYNLGSNPLLQGMNDLKLVLREILTGLSAIRFTPFNVDRAGCPAYDLGDAVTFPGGIGRNVTGCIMLYDYTYHQSYTIQGFGSNPALMNVRSKEDKAIAGLMSRNTVANALQFYTFENIQPLEVRDEWREIIRVRFGSLKSTIVTFQAEIKLHADVTEEEVDRIISELKYVYNGQELEYTPVETWIDGDHLLHLLYFFNVEGADINRLSVRMRADGVITIPRLGIHAAVSGQGLVATSAWDGYIDVEDTFGVIPLETSVEYVDEWSSSISISPVVPHTIDVEEYIPEVALDTSVETVDPWHEYLYVNKEPISGYTWGSLEAWTWDDCETKFLWW